ncbi:MAG: hypothetical protein EAZ85_06135 [Bacteroidetes bacterium]|nr:MAG: hypothetical protein EAZ85_06135 [Bacteroidota bacterium]TAG89881.1 MAG: hypothetical protein EAZ20_05510 [Bacteroidota bacterium]
MWKKLVVFFVFYNQFFFIFGQKNNEISVFIIQKVNQYSEENIYPILKQERNELLKKFSKEDYKKWIILSENRKKQQAEKQKWIKLDGKNVPNIMEIWDSLQKNDFLHWQEADKLAEKYNNVWKGNLIKLKPKITQWEADIQNIIAQAQSNLDEEKNQIFKKHKSEKLFFLTDVLLETFEKTEIIAPTKQKENAAEGKE